MFVVPAIIVVVLLAAAVVVVLFGASSVTQQRTIAELLDVLEKGNGERQLPHVLLPNEREYWQAAQELSKRVAGPGRVLSPEKIEHTAKRIVGILEAMPAPANTAKPSSAAPRHFLMLALGRLGSPVGVPVLLNLAESDQASTRMVAFRSLAEMHDLAEARRALPAALAGLDDPDASVRLVACVAIAAIAARGDAVAIRALSDKLAAEREMQWNAAIALARLGSDRGKLVLENMLQRAFWAGMELEYVDDGSLVQRRFTSIEISNRLVAAIEAASLIEDAELRSLISALREDEDESHLVREAARAAASEA